MNEVKYYRKKPVVIQAYQTDKVMYIETLEGTHKANVGDFIITGVHGEQYPCKPDIFKKTYEQVSEKDYLALKDKPIYADIICYSKKEYEEYDSAIEKQKPKKPLYKQGTKYKWIDSVREHGRYHSVEKYSNRDACPNCKKDVLKTPYCEYCGQALDWSEEK